ncbi:MAG TPA: T9SS type A sorting domain-containing protein [Bacteroidota bacterium]|nr:T9SS type A sorting domain-containing protein [Bacteroidota bacterium]
MPRKLLLTATLLCTLAAHGASQILAQIDSVLEGNINSSITLTATKKYLLRGFVNVNPPATITIPAGTIIFGEKSTKGTLIINRGAKINAQGTSTNPIVFTSQLPPGQRGPGDWGGILIAGYASINVPGGTATIEGGTGTTYGGGSSPNDDDSSGVMRYVRIEFPGIAFLPDNEINGLTLGGVGRKTVLEYIQVSYSGDDAFEWFGGTVNGKYLISFKPVDDDFDTDFGFRGKLQFGLSLRDPNIADISGSNGFESDNDGTGTFNAPRTQPIFSNYTMIGPMPDTSASVNSNHRRGIHLRRSTLTSIYNSIFMGYRTGALLDGSNVVNAATGDTLQIRNSIWAGMRAANGFTTTVGSFDAEAWYATTAYGNRRYVQPSEVMLRAPFNLTTPDPIPQAGSPALSGASFSNSRLQDPFFTVTSYVGAFGSGARWDSLWTNYDPQNTSYGTLVSVERIESKIPEDYKLLQNYPNPFNPGTTIRFAIPVGAHVTLRVFDMLGREIQTLVDAYVVAGEYKAQFDATDLPTGMYIYRLQAGTFSEVRKMILAK